MRKNIVISYAGLHLECILNELNASSHCSKVRKKLDDFFRLVLLPRILRGELIDLSGGQTKDNAQVYCWCQQEEFGRMIACDNPTCRIEWFHFSCVGLSRKPKGRWYTVLINARKTIIDNFFAKFFFNQK